MREQGMQRRRNALLLAGASTPAAQSRLCTIWLLTAALWTSADLAKSAAMSPPRTLVLYHLTATDSGSPHTSGEGSAAAGEQPAPSLANLRHFIAAVLEVSAPLKPAGPVDYVFLVPEGSLSSGSAAGQDRQQSALLPRLPEPLAPQQHSSAAGSRAVTARYVELGAQHSTVACSHGWGAAGWFLQVAEPAAIRSYNRFVFVDSSVAGPFLPKYAVHKLHWLTPFVSKLGLGDVRLVAPTISCAQTRGGRSKARRVPHPELGFVALDAVTLRALLMQQAGFDQQLQGGGVFGCYSSAAAAEHYVASAAAQVLLDRGWSLDSLMMVLRSNMGVCGWAIYIDNGGLRVAIY